MQISSLVLAPLLTLVTADGLALQTGHQGRNDPQAGPTWHFSPR
ncbi:MAG: hypothetical protein P8X48_01220 [Acidiferrobacteraceae bacterium]